MVNGRETSYQEQNLEDLEDLGDLGDFKEVDELDGRDDMDEKVVEEDVHGKKDDVCININVDQFHCNNITIY